MNRERLIYVPNGWAILPVTIAIFAAAVALFVRFILTAVAADQSGGAPNFYLLVGGVLVLGLGIFSCFGYFTLQPNEARVLFLFGGYRGSFPITSFGSPYSPAPWAS